ncbi:RDS/peripherin-like protein xRDS35 [Bombyx mandarina]|uniref:RDS/peripherin-like protein xRDS35 n=1 Tax=Bombyx mandarina TaxID=7092 RepID=A0A6J2KGJ7_BOMMA|nr:RDS/peripherin-like protein xRDS35 [Bombyx mandarina]
MNGLNHPLVIWSACWLWLSSFFSIIWSLFLFYCLSDILTKTGMDLMNAFVLLSGLVMLPSNVHILCSIARGKRIDHNGKVVCCPLWLSIISIIIVNIVGLILCIHQISTCHIKTFQAISDGMRNYRRGPRNKHFIDNLQWFLDCCGLNSYKDWFSLDWFDKVRDYEWDSTSNKRNANIKEKTVSDSVPLSCCKSGSCIPNYLIELGTHSINTKGCGEIAYNTEIVIIYINLLLFVSIVLTEILFFVLVMDKRRTCSDKSPRNYDIMQVMPMKNNLNVTSSSIIDFNSDGSTNSELNDVEN